MIDQVSRWWVVPCAYESTRYGWNATDGRPYAVEVEDAGAVELVFESHRPAMDPLTGFRPLAAPQTPPAGGRTARYSRASHRVGPVRNHAKQQSPPSAPTWTP